MCGTHMLSILKPTGDGEPVRPCLMYGVLPVFVRGSNPPLGHHLLVRPHPPVYNRTFLPRPHHPSPSSSIGRNHREKMVTLFRRSLSFPPPKIPRRKGRVHEKAYNVRSNSLPCRPHSIVSQLEDEIHCLREWQSKQKPKPPSPAWLCNCLVQLELLLHSVNDLLQLPHSQDFLYNGTRWTEWLLEDFLRFADAHGTFRSSILALKAHQAEAQMSVRRMDEARLASSIRCQKRTEKELVKLVMTLSGTSKTPSTRALAFDAGKAEVTAIMREVAAVISSVSASLFSGLVAVSSAASTAASSLSSSKSSIRSIISLTKKGRMDESKKDGEQWRMTLQKLQELQECIEVLESRGARVYRSLISARVSLLNSLSSSL